MARDHEIKTLKSGKKDRTSLLWILPNKWIYYCRKWMGERWRHRFTLFIEGLSQSASIFLNWSHESKNCFRTACHSTDFIMIVCMDDRASLTLATWRPSDQSFYWASRVFRQVSEVASLSPLIEPLNRFPKVSYFQPVYQTAIKIISQKTKTGLSTALFHPVWKDWSHMHRT